MNLWLLFTSSIFGLAFASHIHKAEPNLICVTALATISIKHVPTATSSRHKTYMVHSTKYDQPAVTRTPKPVTKTKITTVISTIRSTATAATNVLEVVDTKYQTVTITADETTSISTTTETIDSTTTPTTTVTVEATPSFRPILDTLPDSVFAFSGSGIPAKRDVMVNGGTQNIEERQPVALSPYFTEEKDSRALSPGNIPRFPHKVSCIITISIYKTIVITKTKPRVSTTTIPALTTIITKTKTIKSTSTVVPDDVTIITTSTVTSTIETTTTPGTTITSTTTTTNLVSAPGPTLNAMCRNSRNYADSTTDRRFLMNANFPFPVDIQEIIVDSAYQCCMECFARPTCAGSIFQFANCLMFTTGDSPGCRDSVCEGKVRASTDPGTFGPFTFMNGPFIQWTGYAG